MKQQFQWKHLTMGTCYYPEHWPENLWADDLDRMLKAGISSIRIGEFAWNMVEPTEGYFTDAFFRRFLDLCSEKRMKVIFGTPTATPPAWLTEKYPEVLNCRRDGIPYRHGSRRHYNYNSPKYREKTELIVDFLGKSYGQHPAVIGWQIDNELNCETDEFYSQADEIAFREYLRKKFGTLDALNEAMGTVFWNQVWTDWREIHLPGITVSDGPNPHMMLEYSRFISDSTISFCRLQADILRKYCKNGDFITTNGMFGNLDNVEMAKQCLDVYTYDSYPNFAYCLDEKPCTAYPGDRKWSLRLSEVRGICPHFGIMEQQSGANGWVTRMEAPAPRPGQISLWAMQSIAHGADYVSFFRWRTAPVGTEIYWHGILDYDNRDNRKLHEVSVFGKRLSILDEVAGADFIASFGWIRDMDNEWDRRTDHTLRRINRESSRGIEEASIKARLPFDTVYIGHAENDSLAKYPVLIWPHPTIITEESMEKLKKYVWNGGTLLIGCRAGYKDRFGHCPMRPQPGLLAELTGSDVRDFTFAHPAEETPFVFFDGEIIQAPLFNDILTVNGDAEIIARYQSSYYRGEGALTANRYGKGLVLHWGSIFSPEAANKLLSAAGAVSPFAKIAEASEGIELVLRRKDRRHWLFALNYLNRPGWVRLKQSWTDPETGNCIHELTLQAFGTAVLTFGN